MVHTILSSQQNVVEAMGHFIYSKYASTLTKYFTQDPLNKRWKYVQLVEQIRPKIMENIWNTRL